MDIQISDGVHGQKGKNHKLSPGRLLLWTGTSQVGD